MSPLVGTAGHAPSHPVSSFQSLVRTGENNWSLPELVHAVVLLAHYHALASFVFGSGINPERDPEVADGFRLISVNSFCGCDVANDNSIENSSLADANFRVCAWVSGLPLSLSSLSREKLLFHWVCETTSDTFMAPSRAKIFTHITHLT